MPVTGMTYVTVTGTFVDGDGAPRTGTIRFHGAPRLVNQSTEEIVLLDDTVVELDDNGAISVELACTDDPDFLPADWSWLVTERIAGRTDRTYAISLPGATATQDLSDIGAIDPVDARHRYVISPEVATLVERVDLLWSHSRHPIDCDATGLTPANADILAAIAEHGDGHYQLPPGIIQIDTTGGDFNPGPNVHVWGHGRAFAPGGDAGTTIRKVGDGTGWVVDNGSGLHEVHLDGEDTGGILVHFLGSRAFGTGLSGQDCETIYRWGSTTVENNSSEFTGFGIAGWRATGTDPYTGGAVFHDTTPPDADSPNCDSGKIVGLEIRLCDGNGQTWGAAQGWQIYGTRVAENGQSGTGIGVEVLAANRGLQLYGFYSEENADEDLLIREGARDYYVDIPRWEANAGNNYIDENEEAEEADASADWGTTKGIVFRRPSDTDAMTASLWHTRWLNISDPSSPGFWRMRQQLDGNRGLQMLLLGTTNNGAALHIGYGKYFNGEDTSLLIAATLAGTLNVIGQIAASAGINVANGFDITTGQTTGSSLAGTPTQKTGMHGARVAQRANANQAAVATTPATNSTPFGFTESQANGIITLLNELRAALVEKGIIKGSA